MLFSGTPSRRSRSMSSAVSARLLVVVPDAAHGELAAVARVGVQASCRAGRRLFAISFEAAPRICAGRAVILLQPDHVRAGEILLEAQDVVHLRAAPAIDGLVVVADAADVVVALREQPQPEILRDVGVLVLVHQDVGEPAVILLENVRVFLEQPQVFEQQVAEIGRVQLLEPLLIGRVKLDAAPVREAERLARRHLRRASSPLFFQPSISPASWRAGQRFSSSFSAWMSCLMSRIWSSVSRMVKLLESPTSSAWRRRMRMPMEWNVPSQGMPSAAPPSELADALLHLARGLVGEGHGEDFVRPRAVRPQDDARCAWSAPASCPCPRPPAPAPARPAARRPARCSAFRPLR